MNQSISLLDHPLVSARYFFPRRVSIENPFWVECGDVRLSCYFLRGQPGAKTVIFFHGNGEVVADYIELFVPLFSQVGYNCLLAEYRGYGMSGGYPALQTMLGDVAHIVEAAGAPPEQLILFGRSIGSIYAIHGAYLFPRAAGLIIESGIAHLMERLLIRLKPHELGIVEKQLREEVDTHFNQPAKLAGYKGASLILHARGDSLVPWSQGQQLHDWAPPPKTLKIFDQGDHNDILAANAEAYIRQLYTFLAQLT
jgi:hypothetical protein